MMMGELAWREAQDGSPAFPTDEPSASALRPSALAMETSASSFSFADWLLASAISLASISLLLFSPAFRLRAGLAREFPSV